MNCAHARQMLDAYIDNELDAATSAQMSQHLAECPACMTAQAERDALRLQVRAHAPYFEAPAALRTHVETFTGAAALRAAPSVAQAKRPSWFAAGALASAAALAGLLSGLWFARPPADDPLREHVVASHIASLADSKLLIDVAASDQHVIKPWFQGKIDFAPAVPDFAAEGFKLAGARLDHIADRQAAAIVYRVRNHVINVFVWRAKNNETSAPTTFVERGFGVTTWTRGGLRYAAISDVETRDLQRFATLMNTNP